jgi:hypothetical protein
MAPTRELAVQIKGECDKFGGSSKIKNTCIYGGVPKDEQRRVLRAGGAFGLDVLLARADLRDAAPAIALTHCQLLRISREALLTLAAPHPAASQALRVVAIHRALRRGFVLAARHLRHSLLRRDPSASDALTTALAGDRAAAGEAVAPTTAPPPSSPSPARAVLSSTYDLLPPWYCAEAPPWARPEAPPPPPHAGAVVSAPLGWGSEALGAARPRARSPFRRTRARVEASRAP